MPFIVRGRESRGKSCIAASHAWSLATFVLQLHLRRPTRTFLKVGRIAACRGPDYAARPLLSGLGLLVVHWAFLQRCWFHSVNDIAHISPFLLRPFLSLKNGTQSQGTRAPVQVRGHCHQTSARSLILHAEIRSKNDLSKQLSELKTELLTLRVQKIAGGSASKLTRMYVLLLSQIL